MDWQDEIITLFVQICDDYKNGLWTYCQRFTNYANLSFTDEEVMTIYIYGTMEGRTTKKQIYNQAKKYWGHLFPKLLSYVAFVQRLNKLGDVFVAMIGRLQNQLHIVGSAKSSTIPIPEIIGITSAGASDIKAYEQILPDIAEYAKFADKAYISESTVKNKTYTPVKKQKGQESLDSADRLYLPERIVVQST
jgi:hypothetical protein